MFDYSKHLERIQWYKEARFGMFIHWGLYALPARGEWVRSNEEMEEKEYLPYFEEFNPQHFDPKQWAKAAKQAGMKYAVLTSKHHDGFCLFDSAYTDFKSTNTKYGKDIVAQFLEAFRAEGIKVGLYYSLLDWHHPDYPHYHDAHHPMRNHPEYSNENRNFDNYLTYMHNQVRELCTNYGKLDILWFDFSYENTYYSMKDDSWKAKQLVDMVRQLQPGILIDNRLEVSGEGISSLQKGDPVDFSGDFVCPENIIPPAGIVDGYGRDVMWECCMTMNDNWGYCQKDENFKSAGTLIKKLVECVSKGGNLLLNVGPDGQGRIPEQSLTNLKQIGEWMKKNSESIYNCGKADISKPENGRITRNGNTYFYHLYEQGVMYEPLYGICKEGIRKITLLDNGTVLPVENNWNTANYPDITFVKVTNKAQLPDLTDTVIKIEY